VLSEYLAASELFAGLDRRLIDETAGRAQLLTLAAGRVLFRQGDPSDDLFLVVRGALRILVRGADGRQRVVATRGPGTVVGEMQVLSGGVRSADVETAADTDVVRLPRPAFDDAAAQAPDLLRRVAGVIRRRLRREHVDATFPPLFGPLGDAELDRLDTALEWRHLPRGGVLAAPGETAGGLHVIVSGRLQVTSGDGGPVSELTRGDSFGELELLTGEAGTARVTAARDAEIATLPRPAFDKLVAERPASLVALARHALQRASRARQAGRDAVTTVAVRCLDPSLAVLAADLARSLAAIGPVMFLDSAIVERTLGTVGIAQADDRDPHHIRLSAWLAEIEARHRFVVFLTDPGDSPWTRRCLRLADHLLAIDRAAEPPGPHAMDTTIGAMDEASLPARRALVLVHDAGGRSRPAAAGAPVDRVHRVRAGSPAGIERVARIVGGRSVGLALSGGGARAFAHVGVLRALEEARIPIDLVGGTSMGAMVASLHALGLDAREIARTLWDEFVRMKPHRDYTLPLVGLNPGRKFERSVRAMFGEARIEDLWLDCFCVSTNLTTAEMAVHTHGPVWRALRASCALPAIGVPTVVHGQVFVDGGIVNNLPGDVLRDRGAGVVIAVDVGSSAGFALADTDEAMPSPWQSLWRRLRRRSGAPAAFTILDVIERSIVVTSTRRRQQVAETADLYLTPPVEHYGLMDFTALHEIEARGYEYARARLAVWTPGPGIIG
jgi:NTE family protein/lysophospholipid hydrolase